MNPQHHGPTAGARPPTSMPPPRRWVWFAAAHVAAVLAIFALSLHLGGGFSGPPMPVPQAAAPAAMSAPDATPARRAGERAGTEAGSARDWPAMPPPPHPEDRAEWAGPRPVTELSPPWSAR